MTFLFTEPSHLWLEISPTNQSQSWQQSQCFSMPSNGWRAYLNHLCLNAFVSYLKEEYQQNAQVWPNLAALPSIWEVVTGTAITLGQKRLILIPTETIDDDELRVPQEWIDIPSWVGDYYLAVQVNPDELSIRIWGYTTHQHLKTQGRYDTSDRTYCLDGEDLITDLTVLWLSQEFCPEETTKATVNPLAMLPTTQAENLLQRLGNPDVIFPRLAVPFALWGALLDNHNWREQLYQQRQGLTDRSNNLRRWFENLLESGWQTPEALNLAFNNTRNAVDESVRQVKLIELGEQRVILLIELNQEADGRVSVSTFLYPDPPNRYLPDNIRLILLSESAETLQVTQSRAEDNYIRIPRFRCASEFRFSLQVILDEFITTENFII